MSYFEHQPKDIQKQRIQWNLDLVTIDLVTNCDLVTPFRLTDFLLNKIHGFSDKFVSVCVLI